MAETKPQPGYRIRDLQFSDRPRGRLASLGAQNLHILDLIAILLRVGVPGENAIQMGQRLLHKFNQLSGLHRADFHELCEQHGIGIRLSLPA